MQFLSSLTSVDKILSENSARSNLDSDGKVSFHLSLKSSEDSNSEIVLIENNMIKYCISSDLLKKCESEGVNDAEIANWMAHATQTVSDQVAARKACVVHKIVEFIESHLLPTATPLLLESPFFVSHIVSINQMENLGSGTFGNVYRIKEIGLDNLQRLPVDMVLKLPGSDSDAQREIRAEIDFIHELHKRLTPVERKKVFPDVHEVTYMGKTGYLMERFDGNLKQLPMTLEKKVSIAAQLVEQMAILSKYHAIYTDIKLENIFIKNKKAVLSDFGNCHFIELRNSIPNYGFTYSPSYVSKDDHLRLFSNLSNVDDATLQTYAEQHEARALGLLLCYLFSGQSDIVPAIYTQQVLVQYFNQVDPLKGLRTDHPALCSIIAGMLGLNQPQLTPVQAWEKWSASEGKNRSHKVDRAMRLIHRARHHKIARCQMDPSQKAKLIRRIAQNLITSGVRNSSGF